MDGAGNSFIVFNLIDERQKELFTDYFSPLSRPEIAKELCEKSQWSPIDGLVLLEKAAPNSSWNFEWDFYNSDGSSAEMCGNAARCIGSFAFANKISPENHQFKTIAGLISAHVLSATDVEVGMTPIVDSLWHQSLKTPLGDVFFNFINSGVPHCVISVAEPLNHEKLRPLAQELRKPSYFAPNGANITFIFEQETDVLQSVSFERGVEDFTLACGTGAVASAVSYLGPNSLEPNKIVTVHVPGGELIVKFAEDRPYLRGPVRHIKDIDFIKK